MQGSSVEEYGANNGGTKMDNSLSAAIAFAHVGRSKKDASIGARATDWQPLQFMTGN